MFVFRFHKKKKLTKLSCLNKIIYFFLSISFEGISLQKQLSLKKNLKDFFSCKKRINRKLLAIFCFQQKKDLFCQIFFFFCICVNGEDFVLLRRMVGWIHFRHTYTKREQTLYLGWWFNKSFSLRTFETTDSFRRPHKTE